MFINCPIVRLQVGFVQIHVCCVLTLKYVNRIQSMFTELNLVTGQSEFGKLRCRKESCIDAKNSANLLISHLVLQIYKLSFIVIMLKI